MTSFNIFKKGTGSSRHLGSEFSSYKQCSFLSEFHMLLIFLLPKRPFILR